jgi:hypothetical protein
MDDVENHGLTSSMEAVGLLSHLNTALAKPETTGL